jgi:hypothetical protein
LKLVIIPHLKVSSRQYTVSSEKHRDTIAVYQEAEEPAFAAFAVIPAQAGIQSL